MMKRSGENNGLSGSDRVYLDFYNLNEAPFSMTPDPQFFLPSKTHQNAIDKISYSIQTRMGFIVLTGEVGTGKTTICRYILDKIDKYAKTVYIINPSLSGQELIASILDDLGINYSPDISKKNLISLLNDYILSLPAAFPLVIIVDDAQTMSIEALEELRLLSNLESDKEKYIQIVLVGQPEMLELLSHPKMRQLKQRVAVTCQIEHLSIAETGQYISRRLLNAGDNGQIGFTPGAVKQIFKFSSGTPRLINKLCEYVLIAGYVSNSFTIVPKHVKMAMNDLGDSDFSKSSTRFIKTPKRIFPTYIWAFSTISFFLVIVISIGLLTGNSEISDLWKHTNQFAVKLQQPMKIEKRSSAVESGESMHEEKILSYEPLTAEYTNDCPDSSGFSPYVVQLASFKHFRSIRKAIPVYKKQVAEISWQRLYNRKNERWYRLISGRFKTKEEALEYQKKNRLAGSIVRYSPWTLKVGKCGLSKDLDELLKLLQQKGYDGYLYNVADEIYQVRVGTFKTLARTKKDSKNIQLLGLEVEPVLQ